MNATSVPASIYHVFETLHHYSLLKKTELNEQERISIVTHAFFENYYFLLLERFGQNKLEEGDKTVCESEETDKYPNIHPCEASIALAFRKLPEQLKE
jgi:penicillin G amidase